MRDVRFQARSLPLLGRLIPSRQRHFFELPQR
jgi:hypothetical protein